MFLNSILLLILYNKILHKQAFKFIVSEGADVLDKKLIF